jgi:hypothetical protein
MFALCGVRTRDLLRLCHRAEWWQRQGLSPKALTQDIHEEGLCPSSGDINWLMMITIDHLY